MKKYYIFLLPVVILVSCHQNKPTNENVVETTVTENQVLVDDVLNSPDHYVDKTIEVKGLVTHVCKHSGKRLHLTSAESNKFIRVEATGDIHQFERELEGSNLIVKGTFHKQVIDEEYLAKWEEEVKNKTHEGNHEGEAEMELLESSKKKLSASGQTEIVQYWLDGTSFLAEASE